MLRPTFSLIICSDPESSIAFFEVFFGTSSERTDVVPAKQLGPDVTTASFEWKKWDASKTYYGELQTSITFVGPIHSSCI